MNNQYLLLRVILILLIFLFQFFTSFLMARHPRQYFAFFGDGSVPSTPSLILFNFPDAIAYTPLLLQPLAEHTTSSPPPISPSPPSQPFLLHFFHCCRLQLFPYLPFLLSSRPVSPIAPDALCLWSLDLVLHHYITTYHCFAFISSSENITSITMQSLWLVCACAHRTHLLQYSTVE